jgi:hypothetical protein
MVAVSIDSHGNIKQLTAGPLCERQDRGKFGAQDETVRSVLLKVYIKLSH